MTFYLYFQNQLQGFLLFLLKCECGRTINSLNDIEPPGWWPSEVSFVDDLLEKSTKKGVSKSINILDWHLKLIGHGTILGVYLDTLEIILD